MSFKKIAILEEPYEGRLSSTVLGVAGGWGKWSWLLDLPPLCTSLRNSMLRKYLYILLGLILFWTPSSFSQQFDEERSFIELKQLRLKAIKDSIIGKEYYYDFTKKSSCNKTCINYLGQIRTGNGKVYKILTCFYVHGQSCRGTSRILIYDLNNKYIGNYYVTMPSDLPDTIINNCLAYSKISNECKFKNGTKISFKKGLPKTIFIPCDKVNSGDFYSFMGDE